MESKRSFSNVLDCIQAIYKIMQSDRDIANKYIILDLMTTKLLLNSSL